eukprot:COSAG02_NODE_21230_length_797_cov_1.131805_1_plen_37_part_01
MSRLSGRWLLQPQPTAKLVIQEFERFFRFHAFTLPAI